MEWFPLRLSLEVLGIAFVLHLAAGLGLGALLARKFPGRNLVDLLVTLPLIFPPIAMGYFLLLLFSRNGWMGGWLEESGLPVLFSFPGLVIAAFTAGLPLAVKPVQAALESMPPYLAEASYTLGKGRWTTFRRVVFPAIRRSVAAAMLLACGRGLGEVGISLMLGGNLAGKTDTLSLAVYNAVLDGEMERALAYSLVLAGVSVSLLLLLRRYGG